MNILGLSEFVFEFTDSSSDDSLLKVSSPPGWIFPYNTYMGWKSFHVFDNPNFV